jgi:hypothetical protein
MLNSTLKELFQLTLDLDILLNLHYVPSKENLADEPSRQLNKSDASINVQFNEFSLMKAITGSKRANGGNT